MAQDVVVKRCDLGRGLFAARPFAAGERILRFRGRRVEWGDPLHQTEAGANLLQTGYRTYILLEPPGVFANHSCDPNAGVSQNRCLVAIRSIPAGEEIRFDYSTTMAENFWTMPCRCGSPACRGIVTDFRLLPAEVQARYLRLNIVQGFIAARYRMAAAAGLEAEPPCDNLGHMDGLDKPA